MTILCKPRPLYFFVFLGHQGILGFFHQGILGFFNQGILGFFVAGGTVSGMEAEGTAYASLLI